MAAVLLGNEEMAIFQLPKLMQHRDPAGVELSGDLADGAPGRRFHQVENAAPGRTAQGFEDRGHVIHR